MRRRTTALVRITGVLAAGGVLVAGAARLEPIDVRAAAPSDTVSAAGLRNSETVCPGAQFVGIKGVDDVPTDTRVVAGSAPDAVLGTVSGVRDPGVLTLGSAAHGAPSSERVTERGPNQSVAARAAPVVLRASGGLAAGISAAQESDVDRESVSGAAGTGCQAPAADAWLMAGGGQPGRQERMILLNPGANPVTVDIEVFGRAGRLDGVGARGLVVKGRGRTALLLDSLAPQEDSPAIHVTTRGGFVAATVGDYWLDGITPRGIETSGPLAEPVTEQVVAGVPGGVPATVRLVAPGDRDAVVEVRVLTADGPRPLPRADGVVRVPAGATRDARLGKLPSGVVAVQIRSDEPVTGAVLTQPERARDFAWSLAGTEVRGLAAALYPPLADLATRTRTLSLAATGGRASIQVVTRGPRGITDEQAIAVDSDSSATVDLSATESVWVRRISGPGQVRAAMVLTGAPGKNYVLASRPLVASPVSASSVAVVPRSALD